MDARQVTAVTHITPADTPVPIGGLRTGGATGRVVAIDE